MELMQRRRELMGMQTGLPSAYRVVEYLESDNASWIETDITSPLEIVIDCTLAILVAADQYGCGYIGNGYSFAGFGQYSYQWQYNYSGSYKYGWPYRIVIGQKYETKLILGDGAQQFYIDGELGGTWNKTNTKTGSGGKVYIFRANGSALFKAMRIYYIKFSTIDESEILGEFIPCVRKSDSKPGMYDTVSKTFYTNAGTGEFIVPA